MKFLKFKINSKILISTCIVFLIILKVLILIVYSPKNNKFEPLYTDYGGIISENWTQYIQKNTKTCGMACLSFLLSKTGYNITESEISSLLNKTNEYISFSDMERIAQYKRLNCQSLEVDKKYFKEHPALSIVHYGEEHFIVFVSEYYNEEIVIFDPSYGKVYLSWNKFLKKFDGKMFYVYK